MDQIDTLDIKARREAAQIFRNFLNGKITNDDFENQMPTTHDRAIDAIWDTAWLFYDDFKTHHLKGRYAMPSDQKRACIRWILFLHSSLEYKWPDLYLPGWDPSLRIKKSFWQRIFSLDALPTDKAKAFLCSGHYAVWPFISVIDYKSALSNPTLLSGRSRPLP
ncbi:hypothetical protein [Parasulfitobacter algicola]|uniref:Uncharacterized protein n=1 Tax=Parasulfitobacter algicola TaxID=2614809 RepID=A0ABX2IWU5_9RHOB|nr:hypothetical protein [Sulfitobacter algicola]NSX55630.1 hypothetical protein [Sulfitobacter algicola]